MFDFKSETPQPVEQNGFGSESLDQQYKILVSQIQAIYPEALDYLVYYQNSIFGGKSKRNNADTIHISSPVGQRLIDIINHPDPKSLKTPDNESPSEYAKAINVVVDIWLDILDRELMNSPLALMSLDQRVVFLLDALRNRYPDEYISLVAAQQGMPEDEVDLGDTVDPKSYTWKYLRLIVDSADPNQPPYNGSKQSRYLEVVKVLHNIWHKLCDYFHDLDLGSMSEDDRYWFFALYLHAVHPDLYNQLISDQIQLDKNNNPYVITRNSDIGKLVYQISETLESDQSQDRFKGLYDDIFNWVKQNLSDWASLSNDQRISKIDDLLNYINVYRDDALFFDQEDYQKLIESISQLSEEADVDLKDDPNFQAVAISNMLADLHPEDQVLASTMKDKHILNHLNEAVKIWRELCAQLVKKSNTDQVVDESKSQSLSDLLEGINLDDM